MPGTILREEIRGWRFHNSLQYKAGFILVDRERDPCFPAVLGRFDEAIRGEARSPLNGRFLFVCVAIRGFESWFLADPFSINGLLLGANYGAPRETAKVDPKRKRKIGFCANDGPEIRSGGGKTPLRVVRLLLDEADNEPGELTPIPSPTPGPSTYKTRGYLLQNPDG